MIKDSGWFKTTKYYHYGDMVASNTAARSLKTCNVCDLIVPTCISVLKAELLNATAAFI